MYLHQRYIIVWHILSCYVLIGVSCLSHFDWSYNGTMGPHYWPQLFSGCAADKQSPVNIERDGVWFDERLHSFNTHGYEGIPEGAKWTMKNTGKLLQIQFAGYYPLSDGGLSGPYLASHAEFHWHGDHRRGSEHALNGVVYSAEAYDNFDQALNFENGVAVSAFLIRVANKDNNAFRQFLDNLPSIKYSGQTFQLRPVPLLSLLPKDINDFYRYEGSLTTPPCTQGIIWTVFKDPIYISKRQWTQLTSSLTSLRAASSSSSEKHAVLFTSHRGLQPVGRRTIYSSDPEDATLLSHPFRRPWAVTLAVLVGMLCLLGLKR